MLVEEHINELKKNNERKKIENIVKEYNKEIDFRLSNPALTKPSTVYALSITSLMMSLIPLCLKEENISLAIRLIYIFPPLVVSIITIILFIRFKRSKKLDKKKFFIFINSFIGEIIGICFSGIYMMQFLLFSNWNSIDYLKSLIILVVLLISITLVSVRNVPKKFIKQFTGENTYKNQSKIYGSIATTLVIIANMTKPYRLMLVGAYIVLIWSTPKFVYEIYKVKKYDYIQSLLK